MDANCFLTAILEQCRYDDEYRENNFTMELLRNDICSEIYKDENKNLHHLLYFGNDLLDPDDWKDIMIQQNEDTLHCDLIFVQLAANYLKRQIVLIPIFQPDEKSVSAEKKEDIQKRLLTVTPNEKVTNKSYYMLYFPQGQFGPHLYFQSVFKIDDSTSQDKSGWMSYEIDELWNNILAQKEKNKANLDDEDEESDDDIGIDVHKKENKKDSIKRNPKNMKKDTSYVYTDVTMLTPVDPSAKVVVNNTNETIKKKINKKDPIYQIAPGEGKVCTIQIFIHSAYGPPEFNFSSYYIVK